MKISFLSEGDAANVLTEYSYCINKHSNYIKSKSICLFKHPFNYKIQHDFDLNKCTVTQKEYVKQWISDSDVIIFNEEGTLAGQYKTIEYYNNFLNLDILNLNKKICIWHPGSNYRNNYTYYNQHPHRQKIDVHLYAIDLYHLSPMDVNDTPLYPYQYYDFNYDKFINDFAIKLNNTVRTILHIPSNSNIKGTSIITKCIEELQLSKTTKYQYKTLQQISNYDVILEKEKSFFYIDQINDMGGFGIAAVEAFFRSNLVFCTTHKINESIYKLTNNDKIPIVSLPLTPSRITNLISKFISLSDDELLHIMKENGRLIDIYYNPTNIVKLFEKYII